MRAAAIVLGSALAIRLAAIWLIPNEQISDSVWYEAAARSLLSGNGYGYHGERAWFPPGYSFVLAAFYAAFGASDVVGKLLNAVLGALSCVLTYHVGSRMVGRGAGLIAGALVAVWPNAVLHTLILSTEPLSIFLWIATVLIAVATARADGAWTGVYLALGLIVGIAVLTRPVSLVLIPVITVTILARQGGVRRAARATALAGVVTVVLVGAWSARNTAVFGHPVLISTNGGYNLWQVNNEYADGTDFFWRSVPPGIAEFDTMRDGDELTRNDLGYMLAVRFMKEHPDRVLALVPRKFLELWRTDTSAVYEAVISPPMTNGTAVSDLLRANDVLLRATAVAFYAMILLAAMWGAVILARERRDAAVVLVTPILLLTLFYLFFQSKDRFHVPLDPFLALLAAPAILWIIAWARRGTTARRA